MGFQAAAVAPASASLLIALPRHVLLLRRLLSLGILRRLRIQRPLHDARQLERIPRGTIDQLEPIGAEVDTSIPPRNYNQHVLRAEDVEQVCQASASRALAVVVAVAVHDAAWRGTADPRVNGGVRSARDFAVLEEGREDARDLCCDVNICAEMRNREADLLETDP